MNKYTDSYGFLRIHTDKANIALITSLLLFHFSINAVALGISTDFVGVEAKDLKIGETYSFKENDMQVYKLYNNSSEKLNIKVDVQDITSEKVAEWVKLEPASFKIEPNGRHSSNVLINVPYDKSLYGKKFQVLLWAHSVDNEFFNVGLKNKFSFQIYDPGPKVTIRKDKIKGKYFDVAKVNPETIVLKGLKQNSWYDVKEEDNISINITNTLDEAVKIKLMGVKDNGFSNPVWIKTKPSKIKLNKGETKEVRVFVKIPETEDKNRSFLLKGEVLKKSIVFNVNVEIKSKK